MLDSGTFVNHIGESIHFGSDGVYLSNNTMRDYVWTYDNLYGDIANFRKGIVEKTFTVVIHAGSEAEGVTKRNQIFKIFDKDVVTGIPGKYVDDSGYFCNGFVIASEKSRWLYTKKHLVTDVTFLTDDPDWTKYTTKKFEPETEITGSNAKQYPYQYAYRYYPLMTRKEIINDGLVDTDFILRIYGSVQNPIVSLGANSYQVDVTLNAGDRLEINTQSKTVIVYRSNGTEENAFWKASKASYIFEKLPVGVSSVSWSGNFAFDVEIMDRRSEPPWT